MQMTYTTCPPISVPFLAYSTYTVNHSSIYCTAMVFHILLGQINFKLVVTIYHNIHKLFETCFSFDVFISIFPWSKCIPFNVEIKINNYRSKTFLVINLLTKNRKCKYCLRYVLVD